MDATDWLEGKLAKFRLDPSGNEAGNGEGCERGGSLPLMQHRPFPLTLCPPTLVKQSCAPGPEGEGCWRAFWSKTAAGAAGAGGDKGNRYQS